MSASPIDIHPNWFRGTRPPPPERPTFGAFVRRLRAERAASQEAFAEAVGLERRTIAAIERGERGATLATCIGIAEGLELSPEDRLRLIQVAGYEIDVEGK